MLLCCLWLAGRGMTFLLSPSYLFSISSLTSSHLSNLSHPSPPFTFISLEGEGGSLPFPSPLTDLVLMEGRWAKAGGFPFPRRLGHCWVEPGGGFPSNFSSPSPLPLSSSAPGVWREELFPGRGGKGAPVDFLYDIGILPAPTSPYHATTCRHYFTCLQNLPPPHPSLCLLLASPSISSFFSSFLSLCLFFSLSLPGQAACTALCLGHLPPYTWLWQALPPLPTCPSLTTLLPTHG